MTCVFLGSLSAGTGKEGPGGKGDRVIMVGGSGHSIGALASGGGGERGCGTCSLTW